MNDGWMRGFVRIENDSNKDSLILDGKIRNGIFKVISLINQ